MRGEAPITVPRLLREARTSGGLVPTGVVVLAYLFLFQEPIRTLARDWWTNPDAGHGLLLAPVALWLMWRGGLVRATPQPWLGALVIVAAVGMRLASGLAAELFTMRFSAWLALVGLIVLVAGTRQVRHWWLPLALLVLAIPLPGVLTNSLAIPLQFRASQLGTALIAWRGIDVQTAGNVILIPGQRLFVAEACSGLRSLTALISLGVMVGGLYLRSLTGRGLLLALTIPIAVVVNAVRIFLTAFLMYFVDPRLGEGFMHSSEGWALFVGALGLVALMAALIALVERRMMGPADA
jgi:exosortase